MSIVQPLSGLLRNLQVLIIENDPLAAHLTKEAFREIGLFEGVYSVPDGDAAFAYLHQQGKYAGHALPDIIFLDLHLPKQSGLEILEEMKSNPRLALIPVVVISGSENPDEVRRAYELHASCYVRKPNDLLQFLQFIRGCFEFWGSLLVVPPPKTLTATSKSL